METINALKPSQVSNAIKTMISIKQPTFVWGAPGVGKSQIVTQAAKELGLEVRDVRAVLLDPVDLRGLPHINGDGRAHWATPEFLPRDGEGVLFLDELNAAPQLVQAACYQLVLDRKLGEYELPEGWTVVAAGNRESDKAVTSRMPTPLANRFVHLDFAVDLDDWTTWAIKHGVRTEVIGFVRFRQDLLHDFDPKSASRAFPTPRSWEFVSKIMEGQPDPAIEFSIFSGAVGDGAAAEFVGFLKIFRSLPSLDAVIMNPEKAMVPEEPATLYAMATGLARKATDMNFEQIKKYADRLPPEFGVLLVSDAAKHCPDVQRTRAFIEWASQNSAVIV